MSAVLFSLWAFNYLTGRWYCIAGCRTFAQAWVTMYTIRVQYGLLHDWRIVGPPKRKRTQDMPARGSRRPDPPGIGQDCRRSPTSRPNGVG